MPTPDESYLNPFTDMFETEDQKIEREKREKKLHDSLMDLTSHLKRHVPVG